MTDPARRSAAAPAPLPDLFLYGRDGCHLCDEARDLIAVLLAERADAGLSVPKVVERDIESNPDWAREFVTTIPVVELAGRRLELATSAARLRRLLDETLDRAPAGR
ncbi:MAG TPA: glutaredoxin family protein [Candidatus Limnocylindrales bacterium]|nr:glutaredoxin family protein [Candidatus Limnocylindrales bacterium]